MWTMWRLQIPLGGCISSKAISEQWRGHKFFQHDNHQLLNFLRHRLFGPVCDLEARAWFSKPPTNERAQKFRYAENGQIVTDALHLIRSGF